MSLALARGLWRIFVNLFDLKSLQLLLKQTRQHWIYAVFAIVLATLVHAGLFFLVPLLAFFYLRFPRRFWLLLLVFGISFLALTFATRPPEIPELNPNVATYTAQVLRVRRRTNERQTAIIEIGDQQVFMTYRSTSPQLMPGQTIELTGRLTQPSEPTVPHRFNFRSFLFYQGTHLTIHTSQLEVVDTSFSIWQLQHNIAQWIRDRFPPLTSSYLQSFFFGLRDDMDEEMMGIYGDLGILHVFAISGVHVTLLSGIIKDVLKRIGLIDWIVDGFIIAFCIAFVFISGGSISIIRACAMGILAIVNRRFKLGLSSFDIFALVFISNFIINPLVVFQRGFQYSYWISFVLICSRPSLQNLSPVKGRMSVVFLARMASIPIAVASGFEINITSYLANLVLVPLLMQIIIPALLITLLLPFLAPLTDIMLQVFESLNSFLQPFLNINLTFGSVGLPVVILLMGLLLANCYLYEKHKKLLIRLLLIGLYILVLEGNRLWMPYSTVTFLDVGQGDAVIIRSPFQTCTIIVDTGGDVSRIRSDNPSIFANTLEPYLLGNGVRNVDFLILTHEHYDHIAETIPLMQRFNVRNLIISEAQHEHQMRAVIAEAKRQNIAIHVARPLDSFICGNQFYTFVHAEIDNLDVNEDSLVMTVEVGGVNVLLTGDIGHPTEAAVLANIQLPHIDIYHVAHHGSRYSNSLDFMEALNISYAVVQVGRRNLYGHPHPELFEVTDALAIPLLNNAVHGTVQFRLQRNGYQIHIWPFE